MRYFWFSYASSIFLITALLVVLVWIFHPLNNAERLPVSSPVPDFLSRVSNGQVSTLSLFFPVKQVILGQTIKKPEITAVSALTYDMTTNTPLYEKNPEQKVPMASLTKIMTAIVALENPKENDQYIVHSSDLVGEDIMGVTTGELLTLEELLYGLMLPSGNDAAEVLASNYPLGREKFIHAMNNKAKSLGLQNTNFSNPSGLQGDGVQYTTAYDLLVITRYALEHFPLFQKVVSTYEHTLPYNGFHKLFYLTNETNLLTSYPGVKGVKTGYTPEAGLCLVTYLDYDGHRIIGVLLGSNNRREEMRSMLDYSLLTLGIKPPKHN